jgi:hypothetical protein
VHKGYVRSAGSPNLYPLCRPLYALGLDACLSRDKLKQNEIHCHSLFQLEWGYNWLFDSICLLIASQHHDKVFPFWKCNINIMSESSNCHWKCKRNSGSKCLSNGWPEILVHWNMASYLYPLSELMKSSVSAGS